MLGDGTNDVCCGITTYAAQSDVWHRVYIYIPSSLELSISNGELTFYAIRDTVSRELIVLQMRGNSTYSPYQWTYSSADFPWSSSTEGWGKDTWHYIDVHWDGATSGGCDIWVDGTQTKSTWGVDLSSYQNDEIRAGMYQGGGGLPSSSKGYFLDEIEIGTTGPIGPLSTAAAGVVPQISILNKQQAVDW
jgi:hypothetical protein